MEPEGSLPHSQQPATCPYPETEGSVWFRGLTAFIVPKVEKIREP
jgi:hypothetical protein